MTLIPGDRLGVYEVVEAIGQGGMGQVFRARDTKLDREVAIKILPDAFAHDADRIARFTREAKTLASLNHPHIAGIHGLEESGGVSALVMEFVDGEDLSLRIARPSTLRQAQGRLELSREATIAQGVPSGVEGRGLPLDEALSIAKQIADALDAAHAQGIIHRDLKPANIKVRADGTVKVLDFGLAKAIDGTSVAGRAGDVTNSPTITSPAMTHAGMILGTAAYMAPEQARGKAVDKRADVWAFGVILFEMLTGRRLFAGDEVSDTLAFVLTREPDWSSLPAGTPPPITRLLRRCLTRDRSKRLADIADARIEIDEALSAPAGDVTGAVATAAPRAPMWTRALPWTIAAAAVVVAAVSVAQWAPWRVAPAIPSVRVRVELGAPARLINGAGSFALSPDGTMLVFVARASVISPNLLYVRRLGQLDSTVIAGTEGATAPFFSPDGQWIVFAANRVIRKVPASGGPVVTLGEFATPVGGSWTGDNTIVLGGTGRGLVRVPAAGGAATPLTTLGADDRGHVWPQVLPGGRAILYTRVTVTTQAVGSSIAILRLPDGQPQDVVQGAYYARYVASGHLIFVRNGAVFAVPFDIDTLTTRGEPAPVLDSVAAFPNGGGAMFSVADNGTFAYVPTGGPEAVRAPVMWLERSGAPRPLRSAPATWATPRFSPDGRRLAMTINDGRQGDVWVYDWERDIMTRITSDPSDDSNPIWMPDGTGLVFGSTRGGVANLYWQRADGTGTATRLTESAQPQLPDSFHPLGGQLAFHMGNPANGQQSIMLLPVERDATGGLKAGTPTALIEGPFLKSSALFSPDGRWLSYAALETGIFEVYVQPFPGPGPRVQVSSGGANRGLWSPTSQEIYYASSSGQEHMMVVPYTSAGNTFVPQKARPWSDTTFSGATPFGFYGPGFDVHPDGKRFAVAPGATASDDDEPSHVVLVFNFADELRRRVH